MILRSNLKGRRKAKPLYPVKETVFLGEILRVVHGVRSEFEKFRTVGGMGTGRAEFEFGTTLRGGAPPFGRGCDVFQFLLS